MTDRDEWSDAPEVECDHCHDRRPCCLLPDPFLRELYPEDENPSSYWCRPCYTNRCDDV